MVGDETHVGPLATTRPQLEAAGRIGRRPLREARLDAHLRVCDRRARLVEDAPPLEPPDRFRDAIVVVGATASATYDVFTTPVAGKMNGLEVHANVVDSILTGRTIEKVARILRR